MNKWLKYGLYAAGAGAAVYGGVKAYEYFTENKDKDASAPKNNAATAKLIQDFAAEEKFESRGKNLLDAEVRKARRLELCDKKMKAAFEDVKDAYQTMRAIEEDERVILGKNDESYEEARKKQRLALNEYRSNYLKKVVLTNPNPVEDINRPFPWVTEPLYPMRDYINQEKERRG